MAERKAGVHWGNWTFGIYFGTMRKGHRKYFGIDLGPLEVIWNWQKERKHV